MMLRAPGATPADAVGDAPAIVVGAAVDPPVMPAVRARQRPAAAPGASRVVHGLLVLALKLCVAQLVPLLASVYVAGLVARSGALPFSSYTLVSSINLTAFLTASSFLQALYYVGGRAIGRREQDAYEAALVAGCALALGAAALLAALSCAIGPILHALRMEPRVASLAGQLGFVGAVSLGPSILMVVYRVHASLNGRAGLVTLLYAGGAAVSSTLATVAVRHAPTADATPLAVMITSAATSWIMLACGLATVQAVPALRLARAALGRARARLRATAGFVTSVGWPIGAVVLLDSLASLSSQLLVGRFWLAAVPVHAIVMLWVTMCLVVPLGIAQAAVQTVAVLHAQRNWRGRNRVAVTSIGIGAAYGLAVTAVFALFPVELGALLLGPSAHAPAREALLRQLMGLGGGVLALQGVIVIAAAVLRGIGETRAPLLQAFFGYVVVATGAQVLFAIVLRYGVPGVWWGLLVGFGGTAIAVTWRCHSEFHRDRGGDAAGDVQDHTTRREIA